MKIKFSIFGLFLLSNIAFAQPWVADQGDGTYKNPVLFADYSDPDVIRVGDDYYMVSSSFNCMPGIPVLHSKDLVNWEIINHVYDSLPLERYDKPQHGEGSWAPSIRYHEGRFYVYFCTPHDGLFMATTEDPAKDWKLHFVEAVEVWEDPCPLWDDDGNAYLVRGKVCANELYLHKMSPDGKKILDNGKMIYKDMKMQPVIEGPKFRKKDGYYYILAPAGGVPKGWQTVLRSKNIYGPYEDKIVLHQGTTSTNGPHQGGLVETQSGDWWFMHFQDRGLYGRIVHLQPVEWKDGWPEMGEDINDDGIGEPVSSHKKPYQGNQYKVKVPQMSDEFDGENLGLQWQWHANPKSHWYSLMANKGNIRLNAVKNYTQNGNLWFVPNLLLQKFPAPVFSATTRISFHGDQLNDRAGLVIIGKSWGYISLTKKENGTEIGVYEGFRDKCEDQTSSVQRAMIDESTCYLKVTVNERGLCHFSYSTDGENFTNLGRAIQADAGVWIGAKVGVFCLNPNIQQSEGYADVDWFRVE